MRTFPRCWLLLVAVACRGQDQSHAAPSAEPSTPSKTATPIDPEPKGLLEEKTVEAPATGAGSVFPLSTATERQAVPRARPDDSSRPSAAASVKVPTAITSPPPPSATPPPATKTADVPARRGGSVSGPSYETWLETTGGYASGANASVIAVVNAKPPFKCNAQYPYKFVLDSPPSGVTYPSPTVRGMKVDGNRARMPIPFVASVAGSHTVGGTLSFSTCTEDKCLVDKARLSVVVEVH